MIHRKAFHFCTAFALCLLAAGSHAIEQRPTTPEQIRSAVKAGIPARQAVSNSGPLLPVSALIVKSVGVRCGHAIIRVDAATEPGATYKMTEVFKAATAEEGQTALVDYTGTFLLDGELGLLSASLKTRQELHDIAKNKTQVTNLVGVMTVKDKVLTWQRRELDEQGKELNATAIHKVDLKGVKPLPRNALTALSRLMVANGSLKVADAEKTPAICVPCVDLDFEMNDLGLDAAWLNFDKPAYTNPKDSAYVMRARYFAAEITDAGLEVETPAPGLWVVHQAWALAMDGRIVQHPNPDQQVVVETVDAATLDVNAPLDFDAIRKSSEK